MTDPEIVKRLQADAIFFGTRQEPLLVDDAVCREMAECWEIAANEIERLRKERDEARRDACEFGAMLETDADPDYDPESGKFAEIAMSIAHLKGWDCWSDYKKDV